MRRFNPSAVPLSLAVLVMLLFCSGGLVAQSVTLPLSASGALLRGEGTLSLEEQFDLRFEEGFGLIFDVGSSISGVLDLGLRFGADVIPAESSVTPDIGMFYNFAPVKQARGIPISAQVFGSYTFRAESSDFLTENRLIRESRGYTLGLALVRDTFFGRAIGIRTGAVSEYANYLVTTTVGFNSGGFAGTAEVDYAEYPQTERLSDLVYGGYLGIIVRSARGSAVLVGSSVLLDPSLAVEIRPDVQLFISR